MAERFDPFHLGLRAPQTAIELQAVELLNAFGWQEGINLDPVRIDRLTGERFFLATARRGGGGFAIVQYWGRDLHWMPGTHGEPRYFLPSEEGRIDIAALRSQIAVAAALHEEDGLPGEMPGLTAIAAQARRDSAG